MSVTTTKKEFKISKKRSFEVMKVGEATKKGNTTLAVVMREGLVKQYLYILCDTEVVTENEIQSGDDITELVPQNFKVRESVMENPDGNGEMQKTTLKWIELV